MIRAYRVALAAGGPLWRTALGLAVLAFVIAVFVPSPDPGCPRPTGAGQSDGERKYGHLEGSERGTVRDPEHRGRVGRRAGHPDPPFHRRDCRGSPSRRDRLGLGVYRQRNREDGSGRAGASDGHRDGSRRHDEDLHQGASHRKGTPGGRRDRDGTDELSSSKPRIASRDPHQRGLRGSRAPRRQLDEFRVDRVTDAPNHFPLDRFRLADLATKSRPHPWSNRAISARRAASP